MRGQESIRSRITLLVLPVAFFSSLFIKQFSLIRVDSDDTIHEDSNDRQSFNVSEPNKIPNRSSTSITGRYQSLATDQHLLDGY